MVYSCEILYFYLFHSEHKNHLFNIKIRKYFSTIKIAPKKAHVNNLKKKSEEKVDFCMKILVSVAIYNDKCLGVSIATVCERKSG